MCVHKLCMQDVKHTYEYKLVSCWVNMLITKHWLFIGLFTCPSVYMSVCLSIHLSFCLFICLPVCLFVFYLFVYLPIFLSISFSITLSAYLPILSVSISDYLSANHYEYIILLSLSLSVHLSYTSTYPSVYLCVNLYVCLFFCVCKCMMSIFNPTITRGEITIQLDICSCMAKGY